MAAEETEGWVEFRVAAELTGFWFVIRVAAEVTAGWVELRLVAEVTEGWDEFGVVAEEQGVMVVAAAIDGRLFPLTDAAVAEHEAEVNCLCCQPFIFSLFLLVVTAPPASDLTSSPFSRIVAMQSAGSARIPSFACLL